MKNFLLLFITIFFFQVACAQSDVLKDDPVMAEADIDTPPDFPGGIDSFYKLFQKQFVKPNVPGLVEKLVLSFIVEKDGTLTDIKVIHDAGFGTAQQAKQIVEALPTWLPGTNKGKKVRTLHLLPIAIITEE